MVYNFTKNDVVDYLTYVGIYADPLESHMLKYAKDCVLTRGKHNITIEEERITINKDTQKELDNFLSSSFTMSNTHDPKGIGVSATT